MKRSGALRFFAMTLLLGAGLGLSAQTRRAEGVTKLPEGATVVVMPMDVELYALTAGGVREPKAEWTEKARKNLTDALLARTAPGKVTFKLFQGEQNETLAELGHLTNAVANTIWIHHYGAMKLPGKGGRLDWTLGEDASLIAKAMPADYALFLFLRDSTATGGRVATMAMMAVLGVGVPGGSQVGYASLVDLKDGKVVWFNRMVKFSGDVREAEPARQTLENLLQEFPD